MASNSFSLMGLAVTLLALAYCSAAMSTAELLPSESALLQLPAATSLHNYDEGMYMYVRRERVKNQEVRYGVNTQCYTLVIWFQTLISHKYYISTH